MSLIRSFDDQMDDLEAELSQLEDFVQTTDDLSPDQRRELETEIGNIRRELRGLEDELSKIRAYPFGSVLVAALRAPVNSVESKVSRRIAELQRKTDYQPAVYGAGS